ncbi:hypothetical protein H1Q78_04945 [Cellulosimicrobium cellulans]|uniref:hypothetical protein n=1 Tax=Cellulosimicrobium cellulans TaxID=1710 RepID=UPI001EDA7D1A|nr:hypothetical protein [Cellulosimicrobium cellulans]UKJ64744.1 hypothetical protein H1Q78_04945 [Cellulosimicrobium cellulans]
MVPAQRPILTAAAPLLVAALAACDGGVSTATGRWYAAPDADLAADVLPIVVEHGASCEEHVGLDVVESDDAVEVTVRVLVHRPDEGSACPEAGTSRLVDVPLDAPLGARTLSGPGHEETPVLE